jgi:hypothetical protein
MSGAVKSVGKVFKKVAKVAAVVAPIALAVGAVVFTGGAALGVLPAWGAAMTSLTSSLGASGVLGGVLSGALTQAGFGAALGGGIGLLTGGAKGAIKGAQMGAATGAVTGGVMGGMGMNTDPLAPAKKAASDVTVGDAGGDLLVGGSGGEGAASQVAEQAQKIGPFTPPATQPAAAAADNGLLSVINRNPGLATVAGSAIAGVGSGLLKGAEADATEQARLKAQREERAAISGNYSPAGAGLLRQSTVQTGPYPTPGQRFDPRSYSGQYVYDPAKGRIVFVPNAEAAA